MSGFADILNCLKQPNLIMRLVYQIILFLTSENTERITEYRRLVSGISVKNTHKKK